MKSTKIETSFEKEILGIEMKLSVFFTNIFLLKISLVSFKDLF